MIKLTDILNELEINNPRVTVEKAKQYFSDNILYNDIEFNGNGKGWKGYIQICKPYCKKYGFMCDLIGLNTLEKLSQQDLDKFYNEMRKLVQKYGGKEVLNELSINNPNKPRVFYSKTGNMFKIFNTGKLPSLEYYYIGKDMDGEEMEQGDYRLLEEYPNLCHIFKCIKFEYMGDIKIDSWSDVVGSICIEGNFPSKIGYVSVSGDSSVYITDTLKVYNPGYQSEEEMGITEDDWKEIII